MEAFRQDMLDKGKFSARTINKRLQQLHTIFTRAQHVWELPLNPVARVERQPQQRLGTFRSSSRSRSSSWQGRRRTRRTPSSSQSPHSADYALASFVD